MRKHPSEVCSQYGYSTVTREVYVRHRDWLWEFCYGLRHGFIVATLYCDIACSFTSSYVYEFYCPGINFFTQCISKVTLRARFIFSSEQWKTKIMVGVRGGVNANSIVNQLLFVHQQIIECSSYVLLVYILLQIYKTYINIYN